MHRIRRALPATVAFVLLLVAWEAACRIFHVPDYLVPSPSAIVAVIVKTWTPIIDNSAVTLLEAAAGLLLSIVVSVPLGILIVSSPTIERVVYPFLVASQAVPKVALAPIFVVWFGFGLLPKVLIAFFIAFFPIVVNTVVGMSRTPADMIHLMRSLGASRIQILLRVRLMAAAPYIFAGVKIASAFAVVGAIVGEFIASDQGVGYYINNQTQEFNAGGTFAGIVLLVIIALILNSLVGLGERYALKWQRAGG